MKLETDKENLLRYRIQADIDFFRGELPERFAIAWVSYLAGLVEWDVIDEPMYTRLVQLLPNDAARDIVETICGAVET